MIGEWNTSPRVARAAFRQYSLEEEIAQLKAEIADLRISVIAFGAPWAVTYARERGLPPGHLDGMHYDILKRAGARMDDFVRGEPMA